MRLSLWSGLACLLLACGSPLVGGECVLEYDVCGGQCVLLDDDYRNCGSCGNDCGLFVCDDGTCSTDTVRPPLRKDGSVELPDGNVVTLTDSGEIVVPEPDAGSEKDAGTRFNPDTGLPGCGVGLLACEMACVDTGSNAQHCGGCDQACAANEVCSAGSCAPACDAGLTKCGADCINVVQTAGHCGGCGNVCASGICEDSTCADAVPGHVVVLGHTYERSNKFQSTLLGNAVFLGQGAPVRTLVYEGSAGPDSISGVKSAVDTVAQSIGRAWVSSAAVESLVTLQLRDADVFLIHAQVEGTDSVLDKLGADWGMALAEFLVRGGVIVLIDGPSVENSGTHRILRPSGAFSAAGRIQMNGGDVRVNSPGTGIAVRVGDRYRGEQDTVGFMSIQVPGSVVARLDDMPVVFQRVILPK